MQKILFLDFDGVICDSSLETGRTGWFAGSEIWDDWKGMDVPFAHLKRFRILRPLIETGYEAIALMKAIDENYTDDFLIRNFNFIKNQIFTSCACNTETLVRLYGTVRDNWIKTDPRGWAGWHRFYPGMKNFLNFSAGIFDKVYILTTKEKRFVQFLLKEEKIDFNHDNILGLETGKSKTETAESIIKKSRKKKTAAVIDDRLETLFDFLQKPSFSDTFLFFASWGYVLPDDIKKAGLEERVTVLSLKDLKPALAGITEDRS